MRPFSYGSVCSDIEAASVAWRPLGWRGAFLSEIEAFPRAVLAHHYPETPLHGDFTSIQAGDYEPIDLLVGGTPCQSFSVAGLRGGLDDDRGNLALEYLRLADRLRPRWLVWENVPGVLSSNGGRDFGAILGGMVELGYGVAYRVLDAQFFGVAQRRRRVFVVGYAGDWRRAAAVLFERHSLSGHPAPRREAGQSAPTIPSRSTAGGGLGTDFDCDGGLIAPTLNATYGEQTGQDYMNGLVAFGTKEFAQDAGPVSPPLRAMGSAKNHPNGGGQVAIAYRTAGDGAAYDEGDCTAPLTTATDPNATVLTLAIRGRGDGHDLEWRDDGTANAILTPNGGRAGIGVGAVAIQAGALRENPNSGPDGAGVQEGLAYTLEARAEVQAVAFTQNSRSEVREIGGDGSITGALAADAGAQQQNYVAFNITPSNSNKDYNARESDRAQAITSGGNRPSARGGDLIASSAVRRLTPRECERLQGFPDDYSLIPWRNGVAPDGPRYKALGNSMAVPVMAWIGQRIAAVEALQTMERAA